MSARHLRLASSLALALLIPGCGYLLRSPERPTPALRYHWGSVETRAPCLLVLLPGFFDEPETFEQQGMIDQLHTAAPRCDLLAVALHVYDYRDESVVDRVHEDVVVEARRRGYERVWLVGISMGAVAAVLTARAHPSDVDGIVLVSPYLGTPTFTARLERDVARHGSLARWAEATPERPVAIARVLHDPTPIWRWLAGYGTEPERMPSLWLGFGRDDRFASGQALLASEVSPEHRLVVEGRHDWATWRRICQDVIADLPVDAAGPRDEPAPARDRRLARRPSIQGNWW